MLRTSSVFFLLTAYFSLSNGATVRVQFARCGASGFVCTTIAKTNTVEMIYQCSGDDITLYINQFSSPSNIETLTIQNCKNLTISFKCSGEVRNIQSLTIRNIQQLFIQLQPYTSHVPTAVSFENIAYVEDIPSYAFSQIDKTTHSFGCITPKNDFHTVSFKNVTIDTIRTRAFYIPDNFGNFTFTNVKINRMQTSAILAKLDKVSEFIVENSEIDVVEHLAFQTTSKTVSFKRNKFIDIASSGLNGTAKDFEFINNFVNTLQPYSISMLCTNVHMLNNKLEYMKSGALEKISPGLLEDSGRNFGMLKFVYEFRNNTVHYMDAGAINPDYVAYKNVATDIIVKDNKMFCDCINIAWLFPGVGHGTNTKILKPYYESLLSTDSNNVCSSTCGLPISTAFRQFSSGTCSNQVTVDWLCNNKGKIDITTTTTSSSAIAPSLQSAARPLVISISNSSLGLVSINMLLVILVICILY